MLIIPAAEFQAQWRLDLAKNGHAALKPRSMSTPLSVSVDCGSWSDAAV